MSPRWKAGEWIRRGSWGGIPRRIGQSSSRSLLRFFVRTATCAQSAPSREKDSSGVAHSCG